MPQGPCYRRGMSISRHGVVALLIALAAAISGLAVLVNGHVDLGLRLEADGGVVRVTDVTPDGIADHQFIQPGVTVVELETTDGRAIRGGAARHLITLEGADSSSTTTISLPATAVDETAIQRLVVGAEDVAPDVYLGQSLDRTIAEGELLDSAWLVGAGVGLGAAVWLLLAMGLAGGTGRRDAVVFAAAAASPFLAFPLARAGTAPGIALTYLFPTATALVAASALVSVIERPEWRRNLRIASLLIASIAVGLLARHLTADTLEADSRFGLLAMLAAIPLLPALISMLAADGVRERFSIVSLGLVPGFAATLIGPSTASMIPFWLLTALLVAQLLAAVVPTSLIRASVGTAGRWVTATSESTAAAVVADPRIAERRNLVAYLIGAFAILTATAAADAWGLLLGLGIGGGLGYALLRGVLGPSWEASAAPLGVAVAVPLMLSGAGYNPGGLVANALAITAALVVAHAIAWQHPDPVWRGRHFAAAAGLAAIALIESRGGGGGGALVVAALVPLVPGLSLVLGGASPTGSAAAGRGETLFVALTPGVAMLAMVVPGLGPLLLLGWLGMVVIWRRFTLAPLLGFAQRTQQQLDLAVAAAEQERARLAANLHDDALQELTGLVRRLDEAGDAEGADIARTVAERLRGITSDLRLPLLDDLGAGPALEWLVARVKTMADGEVRLERTDPSRPPSAVELAVFRVAQEALANAVKHGKAPITVRYHVDETGHVSLTVDDAGPGIDLQAAESALANGHLGVANMQQRAEQIGALLDIRRWPAGGTHVALEWRPQ